MSKLANVVYAYNSKNDDELELQVGDKIEVISFVEDGWWKGKLKGRIGVFPSNFVQMIDTNSPTAQSVISAASLPSTNTNNKLSLFGNKIGRNSLSSNSLNSNGNGNGNNINLIDNNNLIMNNTQQSHQDNNPSVGGLACGVGDIDPTTMNSSERRAKPIRGIGFGDIFAAAGPIKLKPPPADPITGSLVSERLSGSSIGNTLQKQIPKKQVPPPPTPPNPIAAGAATIASGIGSSTGIANNGSNNISTTTDQAPALPPKPANQFSPLMQQQHHLVKPLPPLAHHQQQQKQVREQAKVVYAYEPANDDELAMQVGDIIDIIDKDIEDAGWWKGELNGKIGVFPDNFVKLIEVPDIHYSDMMASQQPQQQANFSSSKLSHITANRAKGPTRKPPSNLLNKKNQLDQQCSKREANGCRDESPLASLPINSLPTSHQQTTITATYHDTLSSLPTQQSTPMKLSSSLENVIDNQVLITPKTNLRVTQTPLAMDKNKSPTLINAASATAQPIAASTPALTTPIPVSTAPIPASIAPIPASIASIPATTALTPSSIASTTTTTTTTPPWMVNLRKTHAEKKRDSQAVVPAQEAEVVLNNNNSKAPENQTSALSSIQYDNLVKQISKHVSSEISELREEVKQLRKEFQSVNEITSVLEKIKIDLKTCQSATENQRRYIKELVNNLADERKKIASMQDEIDRNLK